MREEIHQNLSGPLTYLLPCYRFMYRHSGPGPLTYYSPAICLFISTSDLLQPCYRFVYRHISFGPLTYYSPAIGLCLGTSTLVF